MSRSPKRGNAEVVIEHLSYAEYLERALHAPAQEGSYAARDNGRGTRETKEASFYGTNTWAKAVDLIETGWQEGREFVGKILTEITSADKEVIRPQMVWDIEGDFVDMGAYVTGEPECMMRWEHVEIKKRVARIMVNLSASCAVTAETLRWKGAIAMALVERLEMNGVRCEVDIAHCVDGGSPVWIIAANVKRAEEPLHPERLAFHLAHPASLRRVMWSANESGPSELANKHSMYAHGHYGMPVSDLKPYLPESEEYDLVIPGLQLRTLPEALAEIESMFNVICPPNVTYDQIPDRDPLDDILG